MDYKKIGLMSIALIIGVIILILTSKKNKCIKQSGIIIGIIQTASHPALDETRQGFVEKLHELLGDKVQFIVKNAQGSIADAHTLAQCLHLNDEVKLIYAIATPAAQAIATYEKEKPLVIAAVTDTSALEKQSNICGINDMIDMRKEIEMIQHLLPDLKTIAIVYNKAEVNSQVQVQRIKKELAKTSVQAIDVNVAQESDILPAIEMACRHADALICPTDNTVASAMTLAATIALNNKKPLFVCYNQAVTQGALAACGVDYKNCGMQAAEIAYSVLYNNKKPAELPILSPTTDKIHINQRVLKSLGLSLNLDIEQLKNVVLI